METPFFNEDHHAFRRVARKFIENEIVPKVELWEKEGVPRNLIKQCGDMGFIGIHMPEEKGGHGLDFFNSVVMMEEIARCGSGGTMAAVFVQAFVAIPILSYVGSYHIVENYLKPAIKGDKVAALGVTEPGAGSDVANIQTWATVDGDDYVINGSKTFITNGVMADFITLAVKTDRKAGHNGISFIVVDTNTPGFKISKKLDKLGWRASDTAELCFENMRVPRNNLVGQEGKGFYYIMNAFQLERLAGAIGMVADAEHSVELAIQYMKEREAFGKKIESFQVLRHKMAELTAQIEINKNFNYMCAWNFSRGQYDVKEITIGKIQSGELSLRVANECLQVFGGFGFMEEYPIARKFRDTRINTIGGGTTEIMREFLAKMIFDDMGSLNKKSDAFSKKPSPRPDSAVTQ
jgi:acyl-CoA dehydrogenase